MQIQRLSAFFMWCSIINGVLLALAILGTALAPQQGMTIQSQWFHVAPEEVAIGMYFFLGVFKVFWLVFNVVPYVALLIIGRKAASGQAMAAPAV